mgnify:CR=1 FL=1
MQSRNLLITGGSGYLGSQVLRFSQDWKVHSTYLNHTPVPFPSTTFHQCDLTKPYKLGQLLDIVRPLAIIHEACSNQNKTNLESIEPAAVNLTKTAAKKKIRLIHVSTDIIFDGQRAPYTEESLPSPLSDYGRAKVKAEEIVQTHNKNALIVRPSLIYGIDPMDHQTRWLVNDIDQNQPIRLFKDEFRSPIWVNTLSHALLELVESTETGILHVAGTQTLNRWDFGKAILKMLKRDIPDNVKPSTIKEAGLVRPNNLALDVTKAQQVLKTPLLSVSEVSLHLCQPD